MAMEEQKVVTVPAVTGNSAAQSQADDLYFAAKRMMDVTIVGFSLIFILPLLVFVAVLIKLDSPGPAIYRQERVGAKRRRRNGVFVWEETPFTIYKFRTMQADAKSTLHRQFIEAYINGDEEAMLRIQAAQQKERESQDKYKLANDPRVTRVGKFLRKTSLDEIPQLWNVVKGDMSLVGPRPPIPYEVELYLFHHHERLHTTPGITGLWQVYGRSATSFEEMVKMDVDYIRQQSLLLDIKLILGTVTAVVSGKGAR
jgi:lipopolysaccharide/colanic/teichoic acid biosynthesis glycosyltransferase